MRATPLGFLLVLAACGGEIAPGAVDAGPVTGSDAGHDAAPACAAATGACDLPGSPTPGGACSACVEQAICACHALNPPADWDLPADCEPDDAGCASGPATHACQVAAVGVVRCMLSTSLTACESRYFDEHPDAVSPVGMELGLYDCVVCGACAAACSGAPDFLSFCCGGTAESCP